MIKRTFFPILMTVLVLAAACQTLSAAEPTSKPNIVIILADDLGYGDIRANNVDSKIPTPRLDQLASQGMRFTDAHAPAGWCTPSRYGLLTGTYPFRSDRINKWRDMPVIEEDQLTLPEMLRSAGYKTAMVGKWHLGFENSTEPKFNEPLRGGPMDRGFDYYFGIHTSLDFSPYYYIKGRQVVTEPTGHIESHGDNREHLTDIQGNFYRGGPIAPGFQLEGVLPRFREEAVGYLEEQARQNDQKPFFLYLALTAPHTPWLPLEEFQGKSQAGTYGDFVVQVDSLVGDVIDSLERLGMADDTLVIFTSDNGPVWYEKDTQHFGHASTGPYRGMKKDLWEGGHRMPFFVRWPGKVPAGSVSDQLFCFTDIMATTAAIVGQSIPAGAAPDSIDQQSVWHGRSSDPPRKELIIGDTPPIAVRQDQWKFIPSAWGSGFTPKPSRDVLEGLPPVQLYDLQKDSAERENLHARHPDLVKRFQETLQSLKPSN
ncbi:sulfatase family protein [Bremerella sp.]|uniref:sulfatase family protein n=1 Tax=Bremerella sp. TaxID=2795602 RepID=UPI00391D3FAB